MSILFAPFLFIGSADRTVKFWDLETFELIGSSGPEVLSVVAVFTIFPLLIKFRIINAELFNISRYEYCFEVSLSNAL